MVMNVLNPNVTLADIRANPMPYVNQLIAANTPIEDIVSLTGVPRTTVEALLTRPPEVEVPPAGLGIEPPELQSNVDALVDNDITMTEVLEDSKVIPDNPENFFKENAVVQGVDLFAKDAEDEEKGETDLLDEINAGVAMGASSRGEDDTDGANTLNNALQINSALGDSPEERQQKINAYKSAVAEFFDADDYKDLISKPDQVLPYLTAGLSMIQSGAKDEPWAEAIGKAFIKFKVGERQETKRVEDALNKLELGKRQAINNAAFNLYSADIANQQKMAMTLATQDRQLYKVSGSSNPVALTDYQLGFLSSNSPGYIQGKWTEADGKVGDYTIFQDSDGDGQPDFGAVAFTKLLSPTGAKEYQEKGFIVQEGNLTKEGKLYEINGQNKFLRPDELKSFQAENPNAVINPAKASSMKEVYDAQLGKNVFIDEKLLRDPLAYERYTPIDDSLTIAYDENGNPIVSQGKNIAGFLTERQLGNKQKEYETQFRDKAEQRNNVLVTYQRINQVLDEARESGDPLLFGTAGSLTKVGKRVIDEVDQLGTLFTGPKSPYQGFIDTNGNGVRDANEEALSISDFQKSFKQNFADTNLGKFLMSSGLDKKRVENLVFTLALQSAALNNQKGRDISDKDIERFLRRAGAFATSEEEFRVILGDLALDAINSFDSLVEGKRFDASRMINPNTKEEVRFVDYFFGDVLKDDENFVPGSKIGFDKSIGQLREELLAGTRVPENVTDPSKVGGTSGGAEVNILQGGNQPSGYGTRSVHDVSLSVINASDPAVELKRIRDQLGVDSIEFQTIFDYIKRYRAQ